MYSNILVNILKIIPTDGLDRSIRFNKSVPLDISDYIYWTHGVRLSQKAKFISYYEGEIISVLDPDYTGQFIVESCRNRIIFIIPGEIEYVSFDRTERLKILAKIITIFCAYESRMNPLMRVLDTLDSERRCPADLKGWSQTIHRAAPLIILSQVYQHLDNTQPSPGYDEYKKAFTFDNYSKTFPERVLRECKNMTIQELLDEGKLVAILLTEEENKNNDRGSNVSQK